MFVWASTRCLRTCSVSEYQEKESSPTNTVVTTFLEATELWLYDLSVCQIKILRSALKSSLNWNTDKRQSVTVMWELPLTAGLFSHRAHDLMERKHKTLLGMFAMFEWCSCGSKPQPHIQPGSSTQHSWYVTLLKNTLEYFKQST